MTDFKLDLRIVAYKQSENLLFYPQLPVNLIISRHHRNRIFP